MQITKEQLESFFEDTDEEILESYVEPLNKTFETFDINTPERVAMFLAQVGHESGGLSVVSENLNYRAERLKVVFPKYFRTVDPGNYARNPEKIANRVYANRMGNGDEASGDGYRYRGRGLIQLTGHDNYVAFSSDMDMSIEDAIEYLGTREGAAMSAGWFWNSRDLNDWADKKDVVTVSKKINGGVIGLEERKELFEEALEIFSG